jgi:hypothetical protein
MDKIVERVAPEFLHPDNRVVMDIYREQYGPIAGTIMALWHHGHDVAMKVERLPISEQRRLWDLYEKTGSTGDPEIDRIMKLIKAGLDPSWREMHDLLDWYEAFTGVPKKRLVTEDFFDRHYIGRVYKRKDAPGSYEAMVRLRKLEPSSDKFLKARQFPTREAALEAGYEPVTENLILANLAAFQAQRHWIARMSFIKALNEGGFIVKATLDPKTGKLVVPQGYVLIADPILSGRGIYALPHVNRLLEQLNFPAIKSSAELIKQVTYAANRAAFFGSGFHFFFTGMSSAIVQAAEAVRMLAKAAPAAMRGELAQAAKLASTAARDLVFTPIDLLRGTHYREGQRLFRAMQDDPYALLTTPVKTRDLNEKELANVIARSYMLPGHTPYFGMWQPRFPDVALPTDSIPKVFREAWQRLKKTDPEITGLRKTAGKAIEALDTALRLSAVPIMEKWVPSIKWGVARHLLEREILIRNPKTWEEVRAIVNNVTDHVESIFGEMNLGRMGLANWIRGWAGVMLRFPGWNIGSFLTIYRGLGGAAKRLAGPLAQAVGKEIPEPTLREGLESAFILMTLAAHAGIAIPWNLAMMGGKPPENWMDFFFPRTGRYHDDGTPEYYMLWSYMRDWINLMTRPGTAIVHKLNPVITGMAELVANRSPFWGGVPIYHPAKGPLSLEGILGGPQNVGLLKYAAGHFMVPFTVSVAERSEAGLSPMGLATAAVGLSTAPRRWYYTGATGLAERYWEELVSGLPRSPESLEKVGIKRRVAARLRGEPAEISNEELARLSPREIKEIQKQISEPRLVYLTRRLPMRQAVDVFMHATEEELRLLAPILVEKYERFAQSASAADKEAVAGALRNFLEANPTARIAWQRALGIGGMEGRATS